MFSVSENTVFESIINELDKITVIIKNTIIMLFIFVPVIILIFLMFCKYKINMKTKMPIKTASVINGYTGIDRHRNVYAKIKIIGNKLIAPKKIFDSFISLILARLKVVKIAYKGNKKNPV